MFDYNRSGNNSGPSGMAYVYAFVITMLTILFDAGFNLTSSVEGLELLVGPVTSDAYKYFDVPIITVIVAIVLGAKYFILRKGVSDVIAESDKKGAGANIVKALFKQGEVLAWLLSESADAWLTWLWLSQATYEQALSQELVSPTVIAVRETWPVWGALFTSLLQILLGISMMYAWQRVMGSKGSKPKSNASKYTPRTGSAESKTYDGGRSKYTETRSSYRSASSPAFKSSDPPPPPPLESPFAR